MNRWLAAAQRFWSLLRTFDPNYASHGEKWISALGGFLGILAVMWISGTVLEQQGAALVIGSMGASAVLLFAVPHSALTQPWAVFGGHLISAAIGVTCAQHIADPLLASALAVGLAIGAMYYLHCIHPPGGATALVAVLGGESVQALGYGFLITPVLENVLIILAMAVVLNLPFRWRRYPTNFSRYTSRVPQAEEKTMIAHSDLVYALSQLDSFIDVSEQDLIRIYTLAVNHSQEPVPCHLKGAACRQGEAGCFCRQLMAADGANG
jgi:CBS-domain-containing membrane protein